MDKERLDNLFLQGYDDLETFYMDDMRRVHSGEVDFGVQWRGAATVPNYQLSWVVDTGELYLQELRGMSTGRIVVIAVIESRGDLERSLEGWEKACGPVGSLQWLLDWKDLGVGLEGPQVRRRTRPSTPGRGKISVEFHSSSQLLYR